MGKMKAMYSIQLSKRLLIRFVYPCFRHRVLGLEPPRQAFQVLLRLVVLLPFQAHLSTIKLCHLTANKSVSIQLLLCVHCIDTTTQAVRGMSKHHEF